MEINEIILLKRILDSIPNNELENYELWINNTIQIKFIAIDENSISIITDDTDIKVNGLEW